MAAVLAVRQSGIFTAVDSAAADPVRQRPGAYFLFHGGTIDRPQGHADQLRLSADRALPADVLHLGGRAADRNGPLVPGHVEHDARAHTEGRRRPRVHSRRWRRRSRVCCRGDSDGEDEAPAPRRSRRAFDRPRRRALARPLRPRSEAPRAGKTTKRAPAVALAARIAPPETEIIEAVDRSSASTPSRPADDRARRSRRPSRGVAPRTSSAREPRSNRRRVDRRSPYRTARSATAGSTSFEPFEPHGTNGSNGSGALNGRTTRCRGCATAGADDGDQLRSTGSDRARRQASGRHLGVRHLTTGASGGPGGSRAGSAKTSVSLAVVTGCTMS